MKTHSFIVSTAVLILLTWLTSVQPGAAQGTAFTYQGRLNVSGSPANGLYDFTFELSANAQGSIITASTGTLGVPVTNGLFSTTIDFGTGQFIGTSNWLVIEVRTNLTGSYVTLSPLQLITPTPYSIFANTASNLSGTITTGHLTGTIPFGQLPGALVTNNESSVNLAGTFSGNVSGNGAGVTNVSLITLNGIQWGNFLLASTPAAIGPTFLVATNVTGDGYMDLIYSEPGNNALIVLTNNGSGIFGSNAIYRVGNGAFTFCAADVNGDGHVDLISANQLGDSLTVLTNNGLGVFGSNATYAVGSPANPSDVIAVDVNGDGHVDLISCNEGTASLTVFTNNGLGVFGSNATYNVLGSPTVVCAADVNGDGHMDLISGGSVVTVLTNNGSGGFRLSASYGGPFGITGVNGIIPADVNGDGSVDLICANNTGIVVLTNNQTGIFGLDASYAVNITPFSLCAADVNADGSVDVMYGNSSGLTVLTNSGNGAFTTASSIFGVSGGGDIIAADVNGDGHPDVICSEGTKLPVLFNTPIVSDSFLPGFSGSENAVGGGSGNIITNSRDSAVGGGFENIVSGGDSVIGGGVENTNAGAAAVIGGGQNNDISGIFTEYATIAGGINNYITNGEYDTIGGGEKNSADANFATVPGGYENIATGDFGFAAGQQAQATNQGAFVWADSQNAAFGSINNDSFNVRAQGGARFVTSGAGLTVDGVAVLAGPISSSLLPGFQGPNYNSIGGGSGNSASGTNSTIGGGVSNTVAYAYSTVGGGTNNSATGEYSTIAGGENNLANNFDDAVGGGQNDSATGGHSFVGGGLSNSASYLGTTVSGGQLNNASLYFATVGGGLNNTASGYGATVPGGSNNVASGSFALAAGQNASATNNNSFVWSDGSATVGSLTNNTVAMRATNGFRFYTGTSGSIIFTNGNSSGSDQQVAWTPGSGSWSFTSDRTTKDRFEAVDAESVLARVMQLPISEWSYKGFNQRHIGAMAQDFHAQFPLNGNDKALNDADLHGVELAAIQGLNQKLEEQANEAKAKDVEIDNLQKQLSELEAVVKSLQK